MPQPPDHVPQVSRLFKGHLLGRPIHAPTQTFHQVGGLAGQKEHQVCDPLRVGSFRAEARAGTQATPQGVAHTGTGLGGSGVDLPGALSERKIPFAQAEELAHLGHPGKGAKVDASVLFPVPSDENPGKALLGDFDEGIALSHLELHVEKRLILFDETSFDDQGFHLGFRADHGDIRNGGHQPSEPRRGVVLPPEIGAHAFF
ncbi:MAG: hypothetical protein BWY88_00663 [Synergistetes bacterium ADurb.Bin520]|nr:MAG: hypothetical protein BWY88_00663 [Synergistetes bacterium ADurb.Bin520]